MILLYSIHYFSFRTWLEDNKVLVATTPGGYRYRDNERNWTYVFRPHGAVTDIDVIGPEEALVRTYLAEQEQ